MRKKLISFLLIAAFVIGMIPIVVSADGDTGTAEKGEYTYTLTADPDTGNSIPPEFGTIANNGRIWTDKSVRVNDDHFDVSLKVLAQEYISSFGTTETQSVAADVLFILDFTGSMTQAGNTVEKEDGTEVSRLKAMVDAANEAIDIITQTNPNNRIKLFRFSGSSSTCQNYSKEILPLAHYTSSSNSTDTIDKYIRLSATSTVASSSTLLKDGVSYTFSESTQNGTCTQYGIAAAVKDFIEDIEAESDNGIERRPYVIMLTDGEPTLASKNWNSETLSDLRTNTIKNQSGGDKYELMATGAILTSAIWRDRLAKAYEDYNNNGKDIDVQWFNIGLGIAEPTDPADANYTACLLNPGYLVGVEGRNGTGASSAEKIKYYMAQSDWAPKYTEKDYSADDNYVYINEGDGYVTFANTYAVLMNAFVTLANIIKMGSMEYTIPIVNHEGSGEANSDVIFTDVIGEGMYVTDIILKQNGKPPIYGDDSDGDGVYAFNGYATTVTKTEDANGQQTLVWSLPANEVAMFTFADREDVGNGEYVSAEPTALTYGVDFTDVIEEGPAYTNAFDQNNIPLTTVTYEIPGDNDYYFDVVKDELHNFVSSTMKTGLDESTAKTSNPTESTPNSSGYHYTAVADGTENSSAVVNGTLGNNGRASFLSRRENMEVTVEKKWKDEDGNEITSTSGLPAVSVTLYRKADDSNAEETVRNVQLSNSNSYSETYTVPIRDPNDKRYTYYIKEDNCPDGYFIADISLPVRAGDGTLTVTNRELPEDGALVITKQWQNKLGGEITDTSSLPAVNINLKRHVNIKAPVMHTVTISATDSTNSYNGSDAVRTFRVPHGTTISFVIRMYCNNSGSATISLKKTVIDNGGQPVVTNSTVTSTQVNNQRTDYSYTSDPFVYGPQVRFTNNRSGRDSSTQEFEITSDTTLEYSCSKAFNANFPYTDTNGNTIYPYMVRGLSKVEPAEIPYTETTGEDELYITLTLNYFNDWNKTVALPVQETDPNDNTIMRSYSYYIEETPIDGYTAIYSDNNAEGVTGGALTVINRAETAIGPLPETGGRSSPQTIRIVGFSIAFLSMALFLFRMYLPVYKKRRKSLN